MKKIVLSLSAATLFLASCSDAPKADQAQVGDAQQVEATTGTTYNADLAASTLKWTGTKPVGSHFGHIPMTEGSIVADGENITGGKFVFNVAELTADDQDAEGNGKLAGHLKSADFFEVEKFPTATLELTSVVAGVDTASADLLMKDATHMATGNLTMKGETKSITVPVKISNDGTRIVVDGNFNIDRTNWNLSYGNDASLGDSFINPIVNIVLHIEASK